MTCSIVFLGSRYRVWWHVPEERRAWLNRRRRLRRPPLRPTDLLPILAFASQTAAAQTCALIGISQERQTTFSSVDGFARKPSLRLDLQR